MPLIGRTPLLVIPVEIHGVTGTVLAKYEALNFTGSIKDRMAAWILGRAYEAGRIAPGDEIVEASSGNTAIAFAAIGRALGHPVRIYMPDWMSAERKALLTHFGAELCLVSAEQGGFLGSIAMAAERARTHAHVFEPRQFANQHNVEAHELTTGAELVEQLSRNGHTPRAFVAGVGTGGSVMGIARTLRAAFPAVSCHPMEPAESPVLTVGCKSGKHRIQGISDEFVPAIVDLKALDDIVSVSDGDGILMAQRLSRECGLGVGISSGANFVAALKLILKRGPGTAVVTLFPDSNKKYLSTGLFGEEPQKDGQLAPAVRLLRWSTCGA
jgi:cysteine synthase A